MLHAVEREIVRAGFQAVIGELISGITVGDDREIAERRRQSRRTLRGVCRSATARAYGSVVQGSAAGTAGHDASSDAAVVNGHDARTRTHLIVARTEKRYRASTGTRGHPIRAAPVHRNRSGTASD